MCDYSIHVVQKRDAMVGETLVRSEYFHGFASPNDQRTAVCLRPGMQLAFEKPVTMPESALIKRRDGTVTYNHSGNSCFADRVVMRQFNTGAYRDFLEFPDGKFALIACVPFGTRCVVLAPAEVTAAGGQPAEQDQPAPAPAPEREAAPVEEEAPAARRRALGPARQRVLEPAE